MWLLLCSADDRSALWAAPRLRARGVDPLLVLTPELLHYSFRWEHRLYPDGRRSIAFTLADGQRVDGREIRGVMNRIACVPPSVVEGLVPADRTYALQEWTALHVSWLSSLLVPVLNLPVMQGLCGAWRHESEWIWLAARAGLDTPRWVGEGAAREPTHHPWGPAALREDLEGANAVRTVIVVDGQAVTDDLTDELADACGRLGALARTRVLGIDLDARTGRFVSASPRPDLPAGGERVIDALAAALRRASKT